MKLAVRRLKILTHKQAKEVAGGTSGSSDQGGNPQQMQAGFNVSLYLSGECIIKPEITMTK